MEWLAVSDVQRIELAAVVNGLARGEVLPQSD